MVFLHVFVFVFFNLIIKLKGKMSFDSNILIIVRRVKTFSFLPDKASPRRLPRKRAQKRSVGFDE